VKDSIRPKNKSSVVSAGGEPSYSGKKKTDNENIACPGRDRRINNQLQETGQCNMAVREVFFV
jgi:hypothetical protein